MYSELILSTFARVMIVSTFARMCTYCSFAEKTVFSRAILLKTVTLFARAYSK